MNQSHIKVLGLRRISLALFGVTIFLALASAADGPPKFWQSTEAEDYRIKRKQVFEFTKKPTITRDGDRVTVRFTSKDFCDATIVIERTDGTILRHLASGVLGPNAPEPFQKNSLEQAVVWDGKDNLGRYIDDLSDMRVRVSLGLKPRFERTLFWHPKKELGRRMHLHMAAQPEGVYVYTGGGVETIRLFSHKGEYIRTVYPFPAQNIEKVQGLGWNKFADGWKSPKHIGYWRASFLPSGAGAEHTDWGSAAWSMAVRSGRIVLAPCLGNRYADARLTRMKTDGSANALSLYGPPMGVDGYFPTSTALSPDGQWIYFTGYIKPAHRSGSMSFLMRRHGVYRMRFDSDKPPELWLGSHGQAGKDNKRFDHPASVAVDAEGRVYIADNHNNRVQIFSPQGKWLKSLPVNGPAVLQIHRQTQELYVFSWVVSVFWTGHYSQTKPHPTGVAARLRVFAPFKSDHPLQNLPLDLHSYRGSPKNVQFADSGYGIPYRAMLNSYTDSPEVWMVAGALGPHFVHNAATDWRKENIQRFRLDKGKLVLIETWNEEIQKTMLQWQPALLARQRLYVDPRNGNLYVMEGLNTGKAADDLLKIDPNTAKMRRVPLPYGTEDMAIDYEGHFLLRCDRIIGRFTIDGMREVPFDYGEERQGFRWDHKAGKIGKVRSGVILPGNRPGNWFESGMAVNPKGEIAVATYNTSKNNLPRMFPGRSRAIEIHVIDRYGRAVGADIAGQGAPFGHGLQMDSVGNLYYLAMTPRMYEERAFYPATGTVIKFKRNHGRFLTPRGTQVPLQDNMRPDKPAQLATAPPLGGRLWVQDAEWMYPGVGFTGHLQGCKCWNARFTVDDFGRSFLPQFIRGQVAVLDTNGNLVLQIGRYGNVDDGVPLVEDQRFRTEPPRSIGGDEVAMMYANYTGTHSDRRLFISDTGNGRILSVKLDYHVNERLSLKDAAGTK